MGMLNVLGEHIIVKGESGKQDLLDFAAAWKGSSNNAELQRRLDDMYETEEIKYESEFARPWSERNALMAKRLRTIYWRSPAYNLSRVALSLVIAFLLGSIYITIRSSDT